MNYSCAGLEAKTVEGTGGKKGGGKGGELKKEKRTSGRVKEKNGVGEEKTRRKVLRRRRDICQDTGITRPPSQVSFESICIARLFLLSSILDLKIPLVLKSSSSSGLTVELKTEPLPYGTEHGLESVSAITNTIIIITSITNITIITSNSSPSPSP